MTLATALDHAESYRAAMKSRPEGLDDQHDAAGDCSDVHAAMKSRPEGLDDLVAFGYSAFTGGPQ